MGESYRMLNLQNCAVRWTSVLSIKAVDGASSHIPTRQQPWVSVRSTITPRLNYMAFILCAPPQLCSSKWSAFHRKDQKRRPKCRPSAPVPARRWTCATSDLGDAVASKSEEKTSSVELISVLEKNVRTPSAFSATDEKVSAAEMRGHIISTLSWIGVAAATTPILGSLRGWEHALEFVTAYVVEYSLSVDNLFVFLLIFKYFSVPRASQGRVLQWGIIGALTLRGVMIVAGEALTKRFEVVTLAFAGLLLFSAGKLLFGAEEDDDGDLSNNAIVKFARSLVDVTTSFDGDRFFTLQNGIKFATPLFLVLLCVELSDIVFALDSVPAVLGISEDTVVIYVSNILAIQGLRNLYFVLSDTIGDLRFLSQALAVVLGFVGAKMIAGVAGYNVPILPSLGVIVTTLTAGIGLSVAFPEPEKVT